MNAHLTTQHYTLQQLASAAGMTVRNVRSYQTRGLIPPPARSGRQSVYSSDHLARLTEIREARSRGATLGLIGTRLSESGSLDADGLDRTWLPLRTSRSGNSRSERTRGGRAASLDGLLAQAEAPRSLVDSAVDELVEAGVLRRNGQRVVAERSLATGVGRLTKHGLPVERALEVAVAAAVAGRAIGAAVEAALSDIGDHTRARAELLDMISGVLDIVVTLGPAATEAASSTRTAGDRRPG